MGSFNPFPQLSAVVEKLKKQYPELLQDTSTCHQSLFISHCFRQYKQEIDRYNLLHQFSIDELKNIHHTYDQLRKALLQYGNPSDAEIVAQELQKPIFQKIRERRGIELMILSHIQATTPESWTGIREEHYGSLHHFITRYRRKNLGGLDILFEHTEDIRTVVDWDQIPQSKQFSDIFDEFTKKTKRIIEKQTTKVTLFENWEPCFQDSGLFAEEAYGTLVEKVQPSVYIKKIGEDREIIFT